MHPYAGFLHLTPCHFSSLKLYVPSQAQLGPPKYETATLAWNPVNFPVPPENVAIPRAFTKSSTTWPNAPNSRRSQFA